MATKTPAPAGSIMGGLAPEMIDPVKGTRSTKYSKTDLDAAAAVLGSTYESGKAAKFTLPNEDAVKTLTNLFRYVALRSGGGVAIQADGNVLIVKGKDRKVMSDRPRKPRETKALAGTAEYARRLSEWNTAVAEWETENAS